MTRSQAHVSDRKQVDVQVLRAIAVILVIFYHFNFFPSAGYLGVDVFFVISGFVIHYTTSRKFKFAGTFSLKDFLKSRLVRLFPAVAFVVISVSILMLGIDSPSNPGRSTSQAGLFSLLGASNLYFSFVQPDYFADSQSNPFLHLWTLSLEAQFYLLFGVGMALFQRFRFSRYLKLLMIAAALLSFAFYLGAISDGAGHLSGFYTLDFRAWEFAAGIVASMLTSKFSREDGEVTRRLPLRITLLATLILTLFFGKSLDWNGDILRIIVVLSTASLIFFGHNNPGLLGRLNTPFVWVGERSYSLYLWHYPAIVVGTILGSSLNEELLWLLGSFALAVLSYKFFEVKSKERASNLRIKTVSGLTAISIALIAAIHFSSITVLESSTPKPLRATELDEECQRQRGDGEFLPCRYGKNLYGEALLIGDSHAGAISQVFVDTAASLGLSSAVATASACPFPNFEINIEYRDSCRNYSSQIEKYLLTNSVKVVVVMNYSKFYLESLGISENAWTKGIQKTAAELSQKTKKVIFVGDPADTPATIGVLMGTKNASIQNHESQVRSKYIQKIEKLAIRDVPNASYINTSDVFCPANLCRIMQNGRWLFTDGNHLSIEGAALIAPLLRFEMEKSIR
jgi:peptidoglycan/LPS O-acetylase OafA/YrhL